MRALFRFCCAFCRRARPRFKTGARRPRDALRASRGAAPVEGLCGRSATRRCLLRGPSG
eukprot:CAMPEP_0176245684 /NCGR_PEP_ID=MMETSP0121_2-20121125/32066_1 /TAXON_ID=160619 /ORGANISM="Kryptoperidinium foliaceum, Strain CCMP 1326" /LENGTH=58 /DNA_ID=CAMNT_0017585315 /DNA_START=140 /DNA_END=313 /DNA_ORIENTATION=+